MSDPFFRLRRSLARARLERIGKLAVEKGCLSSDDWAALAAGPLSRSVLEARISPAEFARLLRELDDPAPKTGLERYTLGEPLGEGAVSVVYRAVDRSLGRAVAVKILKESMLANAAVRERFEREAQALARMDHPNVVRVYDSGVSGRRMYLVMELVEGEPLEKNLSRGRDAVPLLEQAARGVHHAHQHGIIHRDLKPSNILVSRTGDAKVADFGLARLAESMPGLTQSGAVLGTPLYMSPEQVRGGELSARSDVYALGAILYEALTGRPPHDGAGLPEVYAKIASDEVVPPRTLAAGVPVDLEVIALKALEKLPSRRYATAEALADDLRRFGRGEPISARPVTSLGRAWRRVVARRRVLIPTAAILLFALAVGLGALRSSRRSDRHAEALRFLEAAAPPLQRGSAALYDATADVREISARTAEAREWVERALAIAPDLPLAHHRLGELWELQGDYARAAASWGRAVELDPRFGPALYRRGRALVWRAYLTSLWLWPDQVAARRAEAEELARQAAQSLEAAQALGSGFDNDLQRQVASALLAYLRRDHDAARQLCREAIERFGSKEGVEEFHWLLGLIEKDRDKRIRFQTEALRRRPKFALALYDRSEARFQKSDWDGAIADLAEAVRISPSFNEARLHLADARYTKRDLAAARADYDILIREGVLPAASYNGRGRVRQLQGDLEGALADLSEAIRLKPDANILPYMARAQVRLARGDFDGAIADSNRGLQLNEWVEFYLVRGQAYLAKGMKTEALVDLERSFHSIPAGAPLRKEAEEALQRARAASNQR